jgi:dienelactone hydrolase
MTATRPAAPERSVVIPAGSVRLAGELTLPPQPHGIVLFAHGSGSGRLSPRNRSVAEALAQAGLGALLFDLLTRDEDRTYETRFDIGLLTERLLAAAAWWRAQPEAAGVRAGYFGASTGAAAALRAAAREPGATGAVVSRGGRPDLATDALVLVEAPTLLIVGGQDTDVLEMNRRALAQLRCVKELAVVPGATHLFEEPGALGRVAGLAAAWFQRHLGP